MRALGLLGLLLGAACGPSGQLTGRVTVAMGDSSQAVVTVTGPIANAASVGADGTYSVGGLPNGTYLVEVTAPSTLEGRAATRAAVSGGSGTVPPLQLTGAGTVAGQVSAAGDVSGTEVFIEQGSARGRVGSDGSFRLQVAAGIQTVVASLAGFAPTSQQVTVQYGATSDGLILTLGALARGAGVVSGRATYFDKADAQGIRVGAVGTEVSTQTASDGTFTLTGLPDGEVSISYSASGYAPVLVRNVLAGTGSPVVLRDVRLSLAQARFQGQVYGDWVYPAPDGSGLLFVGLPETDPSTASVFYLSLATDAGAVPLQRLLRPSDLTVAWEPDGKRAAVRPNSWDGQRLWAIDTAVTTATELTDSLYEGELAEVLAANGRVYFLEQAASGNPRLAAFDFSSGSTRRLEEVAVASGGSSCGSSGWAPGTWSRAGHLVQLSVDGKALYLTASTASAPGEVHVFDGSSVRTLGSSLSCFGFQGSSPFGARVGDYVELFALGGTAPVLLMSAPSVGFQGGFTGDGASAWAVSSLSEELTLLAVPSSGGPPATLYAGGASFQVIPQPAGHQLAIYNSGWDHSVWLDSVPNSTPLRSYSPTQTAGASAAAFFSPLGQWSVVALAPDATLTLADTATQTPHVLPGQPVSVDPAWLSSAAFAFSPGESALAYSAISNGACSNKLVRPDGTLLGSGTAGCPSVGSWSSFDPTDRYALLRDFATDRLVNLSTGAQVDLGGHANPVDGSRPHFAGDGSRLVFRDLSAAPSRVFAVDPLTGVRRYVGDDDGARIELVPQSGAVLFVEDPALAPSGAPSAQPRGLYVLSPP